ncbi:DUF2971 domain-containing protein [Bacillus mycoides]|uniref:DUF2971 domain-containing protein n=2 Tax=Bacillaceae TaxID=186817 RepID=UPI003D20B74F
MFVEDRVVDSNIENNAKLWRFMDFTKLVSILSTNSLYFRRSDKFKDVFEGRIFGLEENHRRLESMEISGDRDEVIKRSESYLKDTLELSDYEREHDFINCWHLNEYESAAMWDLYAESGQGVAIQTTFGRMKQSLLNCEKDIHIGKVKYIDHKLERNFHGDTLRPFYTKRLSFKHEEEVRLVYEALDDREISLDILKYRNVFGVKMKVNLFELIERVYVSPDAEPWFVDIVKVILEKFNIDVEVIHSDLYEIN